MVGKEELFLNHVPNFRTLRGNGYGYSCNHIPFFTKQIIKLLYTFYIHRVNSEFR